MKALLCTRYGTPDDLDARRYSRSCARAGRSRRAHRGGGAELLRHADHRQQVPDQAGVAVFAGRRIRRHSRESRRGRHDVRGRRPRHRRYRLRRGARAHRDLCQQADQDSRQPRRRPRRRPLRHLRHHAARAEGPRQAQGRRNPRRARRLRRRRSGGGRTRQADARACDRLRIVGRKDRLRPQARRRRWHRLRQRRFEGGAAPRHRRAAAPT